MKIKLQVMARLDTHTRKHGQLCDILAKKIEVVTDIKNLNKGLDFYT